MNSFLWLFKRKSYTIFYDEQHPARACFFCKNFRLNRGDL